MKITKKDIIKRCEKMNNEFVRNKNIKPSDYIEFGRRIYQARLNLLEAEILAYKMFKKSSEEYKIVSELLLIIEEYRNFMDGTPTNEILKGFDDAIMNSVFYNNTEDNPHLIRFYEEVKKGDK